MAKRNPDLSIIVPTYNEVASASALVRRIDAAMHVAHHSYELIIIDDHSSDGTRAAFRKLSADYPVTVVMKKGAKGKALSLVQGFARAKAPLIAMIDADLQYPPEAFVEMLEKQQATNADVIQTSRLINETGLLRKFVSFGFHFFFVKLLFGLDYDTQSGMKLFKASVLNEMVYEKSPWAFDLAFIVRVKQQGALIAEQPIIFSAREYGDVKISIVSASIAIGKAALKLRFDLVRERHLVKARA